MWRDGVGWDGMGWDGMGWDGVGWDGMGWDGMGWGERETFNVSSPSTFNVEGKETEGIKKAHIRGEFSGSSDERRGKLTEALSNREATCCLCCLALTCTLFTVPTVTPLIAHHAFLHTFYCCPL